MLNKLKNNSTLIISIVFCVVACIKFVEFVMDGRLGTLGCGVILIALSLYWLMESRNEIQPVEKQEVKEAESPLVIEKIHEKFEAFIKDQKIVCSLERYNQFRNKGYVNSTTADMFTVFLAGSALHLSVLEKFQARASDWVTACFGKESLFNQKNRLVRLAEEMMEYLQANDMSKEEVIKMVNYQYDRPKGIPYQEAGGLLITLSADCTSRDIDLEMAGIVELARVHRTIVDIRNRDKFKPKATVTI